MDISQFQLINAVRAKRWHNNGRTNWTLLEWAGAMCGESGEAANKAKKLRRLDDALPTANSDSDAEVLEDALATEVADSIIYGLIILSELNIDASVLLKRVFDEKSKEHGFPERAPE